MLDGLAKHRMDRFWDHVGRLAASTGWSPDAWTWIGTVALLLHAALYPWHRATLGFAVGVAVLESLDNVDGAVARVTGRASQAGAYLDAMTDRYREVAVLASVAWVHDAWVPAFAAVTGALLTSYAKARAAMERPVSNVAWPDLFERFERVAFLVALLLLSSQAWRTGHSESAWVRSGLWVLVAATHLTALQRFRRARSLLAQPPAVREQDPVNR